MLIGTDFADYPMGSSWESASQSDRDKVIRLAIGRLSVYGIENETELTDAQMTAVAQYIKYIWDRDATGNLEVPAYVINALQTIRRQSPTSFSLTTTNSGSDAGGNAGSGLTEAEVQALIDASLVHPIILNNSNGLSPQNLDTYFSSGIDIPIVKDSDLILIILETFNGSIVFSISGAQWNNAVESNIGGDARNIYIERYSFSLNGRTYYRKINRTSGASGYTLLISTTLGSDVINQTDVIILSGTANSSGGNSGQNQSGTGGLTRQQIVDLITSYGYLTQAQVLNLVTGAGHITQQQAQALINASLPDTSNFLTANSAVITEAATERQNNAAGILAKQNANEVENFAKTTENKTVEDWALTDDNGDSNNTNQIPLAKLNNAGNFTPLGTWNFGAGKLQIDGADVNAGGAVAGENPLQQLLATDPIQNWTGTTNRNSEGESYHYFDTGLRFVNHANENADADSVIQANDIYMFEVWPGDTNASYAYGFCFGSSILARSNSEFPLDSDIFLTIPIYHRDGQQSTQHYFLWRSDRQPGTIRLASSGNVAIEYPHRVYCWRLRFTGANGGNSGSGLTRTQVQSLIDAGNFLTATDIANFRTQTQIGTQIANAIAGLQTAAQVQALIDAGNFLTATDIANFRTQNQIATQIQTAVAGFQTQTQVQALIDAANYLNQSEVDARVAAGVADWAESNNNDAIPAGKLTNAPSAGLSETELTAVYPRGASYQAGNSYLDLTGGYDFKLVYLQGEFLYANVNNNPINFNTYWFNFTIAYESYDYAQNTNHQRLFIFDENNGSGKIMNVGITDDSTNNKIRLIFTGQNQRSQFRVVMARGYK